MASTGVVFPVGGDGKRSTSALGRAVVADALRSVDPIGARAAEHETDWRARYIDHFRRQIEAGLADGTAARLSAEEGLNSLHDRMRVGTADRGEIGLRELFDAPPNPAAELATTTFIGTGDVERAFTLPYQGRRLAGDDLRRQLDDWLARGVIEPSCAQAVGSLLDHPEWFDLSGRTFAILGAGAEMGPVHSLLRWGADVVAVDLPRPALWNRLLETAQRYGGRLHMPVPVGKARATLNPEFLGADLLHQLPAVAQWLERQSGSLVLGNYVYADGATNVRVSVAVDALSTHLAKQVDDLTLAFLATPTDVFAVPGEAVEHSTRNYDEPARLKRLRRPLRMVSAGRLLRRNYAPGVDPGICDSLVAQQGPNYALAKRLQRWRAAVSRANGIPVSFTVAPPTRTRSVVKNRALAAAYAGAHVFGVEVFEPSTSNALMAGLLVHDLHNPLPPQEHVWQEEAYAAAHGGLWRTAYAPRSALGLAALIGLGAARG